METGHRSGGAIENLIALAGRVRVESHKRTTKSGKVVDVEAYTRSVRTMSKADLQAELKTLGDKDVKSGLSPQEANRWQQVDSEVRTRIRDGRWDEQPPGKPAMVMNPSTAPSPDTRAQMQAKSDAELRVMAVDRNLREADRKQAQDELDRRPKKSALKDLKAKNPSDSVSNLSDEDLLDALSSNELIDRDLASEADDARLLALRAEARRRGLTPRGYAF